MVDQDSVSYATYRCSALARLACGVTAITFRLAGGLIFNDARDTGILCQRPCIGFGTRRKLCCGFTLVSSGLDSRLFGRLQVFTLRTALIARFSDRKALGLSIREFRQGCFPRCFEGCKLGRFGVGGGIATLR